MGNKQSDLGSLLQRIDLNHSFNESDAREIWNYYDEDKNGYLDENEVKNFIGEYMKKENIKKDRQEVFEAFMEFFDTNKDGKISFQELTQEVKHNDPKASGEQNDDLLHSGYLKKHVGIGKKSHTRFFVLRTNQLQYYVDQSLKDLKGKISLRSIAKINPCNLQEGNQDNYFIIRTPQKRYCLETSTFTEKKTWLDTLTNANAINDKLSSEYLHDHSKSGYLTKHTRGKKSRIRFFVLDVHSLDYYISENMKEKKGSILFTNILDIQVNNDLESTNGNMFWITTSEKQYCLESTSLSNKKRWIQLLTSAKLRISEIKEVRKWLKSLELEKLSWKLEGEYDSMDLLKSLNSSEVEEMLEFMGTNEEESARIRQSLSSVNRNKRGTLDVTDQMIIKSLTATGLSIEVIAERLGHTVSTVQNYLNSSHN